MSAENTPVSLLARVRDPANQQAWNEFDARYRDLILRHCRSRGLQTADAEDVRQAVMLSLALALRSFRYDPSLGRFRDYLGRAVHHAVLRTFRRPERDGTLLDMDELSRIAARADAELDESWETDWMHHHMRLAMNEVQKTADPESIAVFERLAAGESVTAVSQASGKSVDAVHKILQRMRARLYEQVARQVREEEFPTS